MAPVILQCQVPGCTKQTHEAKLKIALQQLNLNHTQVHRMARKPNKPKCPELEMVGDAVEDTTFEQFKFMFTQYKKMAGVNDKAVPLEVKYHKQEIPTPTSGVCAVSVVVSTYLVNKTESTHWTG